MHSAMSRRLMICLVLAWTMPLFAAGIGFVRVPQGGIQPQAVIDSRGIMHLVYFSGDPKQGDVFYVHSNDNGATFSTPLRVNSQPGSAIAMGTIRGAQIAVGKNGRVHVAWNGSGIARPEGVLNPEAGKPGSPMLYARLDDAGKAFEPQRNLMRHTFGLDGGGAVAADSSGNVYVAWHGKGEAAAEGEAGRQVWIARSTDDGETFAAETPAWEEATGACGCCGMGIFASRNGTVYGLYRSATESVHRDIYLLMSSDKGQRLTAACCTNGNQCVPDEQYEFCGIGQYGSGSVGDRRASLFQPAQSYWS